MTDMNIYQPVLDMNAAALALGLISQADHDRYARTIAFNVAREIAARNAVEPRRVRL